MLQTIVLNSIYLRTLKRKFTKKKIYQIDNVFGLVVRQGIIVTNIFVTVFGTKYFVVELTS